MGLVPALILNIGIGMIAIQTSSLVGATFVRYPATCDYAEAGRLLAGKWGYYIGVVMFTLQVSGRENVFFLFRFVFSASGVFLTSSR